jgi:hypothetical protein
MKGRAAASRRERTPSARVLAVVEDLVGTLRSPLENQADNTIPTTTGSRSISLPALGTVWTVLGRCRPRRRPGRHTGRRRGRPRLRPIAPPRLGLMVRSCGSCRSLAVRGVKRRCASRKTRWSCSRWQQIRSQTGPEAWVAIYNQERSHWSLEFPKSTRSAAPSGTYRWQDASLQPVVRIAPGRRRCPEQVSEGFASDGS